MRLRVWKAGLWMSQATTRLPFRFGKTTMTWAPILLAQVEVEDEQGTRSSGFASDLLVPRWFDKNPSKSPRDNVGDLLEAARRAVEAVTSLGSSTLPAFDLWRQTYQACFEAPEARGMEPLVRGFGVALLERALIDAACRGAGVSFFQALKQNLFGLEAAALHTELAGWDLGQSLPERARAAVEVRHTVGLLDPLRTSDIPAEERLNDGLPQALDDIIRHYGLSCFKVKLSGSLENDRERLLAIAEVFEDTVRGNLRITVDANEQYDDLADLVRLFEELSRRPEGRRLLQAMLYVEQPLPRAVACGPHGDDRPSCLAVFLDPFQLFPLVRNPPAKEQGDVRVIERFEAGQLAVFPPTVEPSLCLEQRALNVEMGLQVTLKFREGHFRAVLIRPGDEADFEGRILRTCASGGAAEEKCQ